MTNSQPIRVFRQQGLLLPERTTAMDRLAYLGSRCMGTLEFEPDQGPADGGTSGHRCASDTLGRES